MRACLLLDSAFVPGVRTTSDYYFGAYKVTAMAATSPATATPTTVTTERTDTASTIAAVEMLWSGTWCVAWCFGRLAGPEAHAWGYRQLCCAATKPNLLAAYYYEPAAFRGLS